MQHTTEAARVLMGDSLGFHIFFVLLGLTLPILVSWFELSGIVRRNQQDMKIARFWAKIMGLLVVTGVVSGTIIALQMSLVWPGILKFGGEVIGLPFMFETYAFLIEATFLALYLTTWDKVRPWLHWIFGLFVVIGSTLSAYAITSVNSWMNYPSGFDYVNGKIVHVNVWHAMFSETSIVEFVHSMPGYYLTAALVILGFYTLRLAKTSVANRTGQKHRLDWAIVHKLMLFTLVMFVLSGVTGDITGKYLARHEPGKLAAIELVEKTSSNVPLLIGGVGKEDGSVVGPHFKIPNGLSLLAGNSADYTVTGFDQLPRTERSSRVLHTFFDVKMTMLDIVAVLIFGYLALYIFKRHWLTKRIVLLALSFGGIAAVTMVELGWMITEIGRQPWAVRGYVTTEQAITSSHTVAQFAYIFPLMYVVLFAVTGLALRKIISHERQKGGTLT